MQLVVVMAVRKAVSAATTTFTAISMKRFFISQNLFIFVTQISQISQIICCKQLFLFSGRSVRFIIPKEFKSVRSIIPEELNLCDL